MKKKIQSRDIKFFFPRKLQIKWMPEDARDILRVISEWQSLKPFNTFLTENEWRNSFP